MKRIITENCLIKLNKEIKFNKKINKFHVIDIYSQFLAKWFISGKKDINLSSTLLKKRYGYKYNFQFNFLIENDFLLINSDYLKGYKCRTYELNTNFNNDAFYEYDLDESKLKFKTNFNLKEKSEINYMSIRNPFITRNLWYQLSEDIKNVCIDYNNAINYLNNQKDLIGDNKYYKNFISIENFYNKKIFHLFDPWGRFHTNLTVLKKEIRLNYLYDKYGNKFKELDIQNCQPLLLTYLIKNKINDKEYHLWKNLVCNGEFYNYLLDKHETIKDKTEMKKLIYRIFFGFNYLNNDNKFFYTLFPDIWHFIVNTKKNTNSYKILSLDLQLLESILIFNNIYENIKTKLGKKCIIFTVHDSISFPENYTEDCKLIFEHHINKFKSIL